MKCEDAFQAIPMYLYGEVSPAVEEQIEDHIAGCQACARELKLRKAVHAALDDREMDLSSGILQECRGDLMRRVAREPVQQGGWFGMGTWFREIMNQGVRLRVPVGAMALVALGYFAARMPGPLSVNANHAGMDGGPAFSAVRAVESQPSGTVRISLDEVHRRDVTGNLNDENIQKLLLEAVREDDNSPGVRVQSVGVLRECAQSSPVRAALLDAVSKDRDPGVRLKALEGLKAFASEAPVRQVLAQVLLHDDNPAIRMQTIDVLTSHRDDAMVGILQNVFQKEDNQHVRTRVQNALQEMHATVGTF